MGLLWLSIAAATLMALTIWLLSSVLAGDGVPRAARGAAERLHGMHGAVRVRAAADLLEALVREHRGRAIAALWGEIELPLLAALPDCPPDDKPRLLVALNAAAQACPHRETAKAIMAVRNSLA